MEFMAHRARYADAMTAITRRLPFGLSEVVEPNMLGYLLINLCTFCIDLGLLALFHGKERLPIPVAVTLSYGTASLISYVLNRVFNFRSHEEVGRQLPVFVAVSVSNYLIFVLGLTDLLSAVGVYYELARVIAACCEAVYLYCMLRWIVFRDVAEPDGGETEASQSPAASTATAVPEPSAGTADRGRAATAPAGRRPGGSRWTRKARTGNRRSRYSGPRPGQANGLAAGAEGRGEGRGALAVVLVGRVQVVRAGKASNVVNSPGTPPGRRGELGVVAVALRCNASELRLCRRDDPAGVGA